MDTNVLLEYALGLIRHGLTAGGGVLVSSGISTATEMEIGVGAIVTLIGLGWSWFRKWKRAQ